MVFMTSRPHRLAPGLLLEASWVAFLQWGSLSRNSVSLSTYNAVYTNLLSLDQTRSIELLGLYNDAGLAA